MVVKPKNELKEVKMRDERLKHLEHETINKMELIHEDRENDQIVALLNEYSYTFRPWQWELIQEENQKPEGEGRFYIHNYYTVSPDEEGELQLWLNKRVKCKGYDLGGCFISHLGAA